MPFEQRTVTYFICKNCKHEYPILDNLEYNKIFECSQNGCTYREAFAGTTISPDYKVSVSSNNGFLSKILHNAIFQGTLSGLIVIIILAIITWFIAQSQFTEIKADLGKIKSDIALLKGEK